MTRSRLVFALLLVLAAAGGGGAALAGYESGVLAYEAGDYRTALSAFRALAERGDGDAEFMLGAMYFYGKGVPRDPALAAVWFHKAARKGNAGAQLAFGSLHIRGLGVRQDLVKALMWLDLAGRSPVPDIRREAAVLGDQARRMMRPDEIARARRLADRFEPIKAGLATGR